MSNIDKDVAEHKTDEARMRGRNRALGLALFGLVIFIFVVSYFKIEVAAG